MKRTFDLLLAILLLVLLIFPMLLISLAVLISSKGPSIYWSERIGRDNIVFKMPKFRSMTIGTPSVASDILNNPESHLSPIGGFLRRTSLDELPQLLSIIRGDMSFVGPRPALFNQYELISLRTAKGVDKLLPGITGWSQVNGRDELSINEKVILDEEYLKRQSFWLDNKILLITLLRVINKDGVAH
jgi:O-antigen biosynthesis protein WbqP